MWKIILTFGLRGDYMKIRKYAKKYIVFYPLYKLYEIFHCACLPLENEISDSVKFIHEPRGCFFSKMCKIGENCTIMQQVTIGSNFVNYVPGKKCGAPTIGDNVFVGAGAKIIGNVKIGNNVKVGAGCIVVTDVPDNSTVVMNKPRIISRNKSN